MTDYLTPAGFALACAAAASTGAMFKPGAWYRQLAKPSWTPPDWVFPLTWTVLYILMVWAATRVALSGSPDLAPAMAFWAAQIALNAVWTPYFFGQRRLGLGLAVIVLLWLAVFGTVVTFMAVDEVAGMMLLPYLLWVTIAGALNYTVWRMNPGVVPLLEPGSAERA